MHDFFRENGAEVVKTAKNESGVGVIVQSFKDSKRSFKNEPLFAKIGVDTAENEPIFGQTQ